MKSQKENEKGLAIGRVNLIFMGISLVLIIIGFILMIGEPSGEVFNEDIYSFRRITVGPMVSLAGFVFMIVAIMYKGKKKA